MKINELVNVIFPKNKDFDDLEKPVQNLLTKKLFAGLFLSIASVILFFVKALDTSFALLFLIVTLAYVCTCFHTWYLFITDSVMSLEGTYVGTNLKEATNEFEEKRNKKKVQKIYIVKDGVKVTVTLKSHNEELQKGDTVKFYTVPNNVIERQDDVIEVTNALCLFVTKSNVEL